MPNKLANESSPYLLQHAENPVDWFPWGKEAFQSAKEEDKPILLSVGYAACHWCHVMAHESFENPDIARLMNERFINIKVDRQERPDIDEIYQQVLQMQGKGGGWPLTVFLTPQGEPFFGGTYFPAKDRYGLPGFDRVLLALSDAWQKEKKALLSDSQQFLKAYQLLENKLLEGEKPDGQDLPAKAARFFADNTDSMYGGIGSAPKFPDPVRYDLVLRVYQRTKEASLFASLELTLDRMAAGGIYDHLGGGFARYSVDERWAVPHFEKMLYDNGQLVKLYADAYRSSGKKSWCRVFEKTISYIAREMTHPDGGFFASQDADSEGEEGKYYVWTPAEIKSVLEDEDADFACRVFGITEPGNFTKGRTVLSRSGELSAEDEKRLEKLSKKLLAARQERIAPGRDESILSNWNALMIQGLCAAFQATGKASYLTMAIGAADFIQANLLMADNGVYHLWKDGSAKIAGFLDDYAFLANAYIDLYESCFDKNYLDRAIELSDLILIKFWDDGLYFTAKDAEQLIHRPKTPTDSVYPSGTAASAFLFLRLFKLTNQDSYYDYAYKLFDLYLAAAAKKPFGFAHFLAAQEFIEQKPFEVLFAGDKDKAFSLIENVHRLYLPARVLAFVDDVPIGEGKRSVDDQVMAYVCRDQMCLPPVMDGKALKALLGVDDHT